MEQVSGNVSVISQSLVVQGEAPTFESLLLLGGSISPSNPHSQKKSLKEAVGA